MNKAIFPAFILFAMIGAGCNFARFEKMPSGLEYKIIKGNGDKEIKPGNFMEVSITQYYKDSLLTPASDSIPQIVPVDSTQIPGEYIRIFLKAKSGDSVVTRISTDTVAKHNPLPPFAKPHEFFSTRFKIQNIYATQEEAMKASIELRQRAMRSDSIAMEKQKGIDDATIKDYLTKNKINAVRTPEGTYVEVTRQGTGAQVDTGKAVSVLYKGKLLNGKIFDESYDSTGKPTKPYTFVVGKMGAIPGWSDGMVYFKEGGEGKLFIPSGRAYGSRGAGADIKPNTPIMFEVQITKVMSDAEYQKELDQQRKQFEALQKEQQEKMKQQQNNQPKK